MKKLLMLIFLMVMMLASCARESQEAQIIVRDPWVRAPGSMGMGGHSSTPMHGSSDMSGNEFNGAAYMVLVNSTQDADRLIRASSEFAKVVELHKTEMKGDVMTMQPVEYIDLPAKSQVKLEPGGLHIMLIGLTQELTPGQKVKILLVFEKAGELTVEAEVRAP